ncbi:hypothetical protein Vsou_15430 [Vulcanisaeta souniana JCM 11219]|uniref:Uncharacterized protein n=1 Tax=Vulcanisaeta souniana JCM 11219 TaxID=1293586 RepID=A0ABN6SRR1_9CREN|nr:hypothetical protein Vsou_15430 [Vulcanisaeta souniana JCM 11219]
MPSKKPNKLMDNNRWYKPFSNEFISTLASLWGFRISE